MKLRILTFLTFLFSLLIFFLTFYKSEIIFDGELRHYYKTYYIISVILIFFSIILFFLRESIKTYVFIILISLFLSSYSFELFLIFKGDPGDIALINKRAEIYEKENKSKFDRRNIFQVYTDLLKETNNAAVSIHAYYHHNISLYSLSGISNSKTVYCNENGYTAIYDSDRFGFNNPDTEWDNREFEYLLLGDSFTQGACVNRPNDISSVLRTLSDKKVLNLGLRGNGPLKEFATLKEYLPKNTKKILWMYFENDLEGLKQEIKENFLINYIEDKNFKQNLIKRQSEIDEQLKMILKNEKSKKVKFTNFVKLYQLRSYITKLLHKKDKNEFSDSERIKILSKFKLILSLANELAKNNSELYFVYLPSYERYVSLNYDHTIIIMQKI